MKLRSNSILFAAALGVGSLFINPVSAKSLTIGIDLSGSNPLLMDQNFANGAAAFISQEIQSLKMNDRINILTFGARSNARNLKRQSLVLSRQNRPKKIAKQVKNFILALPNNKQESQASTNLVSWLELTHGFDCKNNGSIVVLTDGIESSDIVDGRQFVKGKTELPEADVDLKGCSLAFYGLGVGWPHNSVKHIRGAWKKWAAQAGAEFQFIAP